MIKFFRKIRQNLLSENKFSKYLIYAIGEIVLVVIGILIALQINNWNENRKSGFKELTALKELRIELINNKQMLNKRSEIFKEKNRDGKYLQQHLEKKLPYNDSLQRYFFIPMSNYSFLLSYSTFENLKNQGFSTIGNNELRNRILKLYDGNFGLLKDQENKFANLYSNSIQPIGFKYFKETGKGFEPNEYRELLTSNEYSNVLSYMVRTAEVFASFCQNSIVEIDEVLIDINSEIEKKSEK